jgi:hypothetical protein
VVEGKPPEEGKGEEEKEEEVMGEKEQRVYI